MATDKELSEALDVADHIAKAVYEVETQLGVRHIKNPSIFVIGSPESSSYYRTEGNIKSIEELAEMAKIPDLEVFFGSALISILGHMENGLGTDQALATFLRAFQAHCKQNYTEYPYTRIASEINVYLLGKKREPESK